MAGTGRPARAAAATRPGTCGRGQAARPAGGPRDGRRRGRHEQHGGGPADAEHQPVGVIPGLRFREGGGADRHPVGGDDRGGHAERGAGDRGQARARARRTPPPAAGSAPPPAARSSSATAAEAYLATAWPTRTSAASSAASPNASRQAASYPVTFLTGSPNPALLSHTSMSDRPVTRARSARNAGIAASPPASRIEAVDVGRAVARRAHDVGAVLGEQGVGRDHSAAVPWAVEPERGPDHPHDAHLDPRAGRRRLARVDACAAAWAGDGQVQRQDVADPLVVGGQEVRADDHLVRPARVGHPAREHHRPFHGLARVRVRRREAECRRRPCPPPRPRSRRRTSPSAVTSGSAATFAQSKPGWFGSTVTVAGSVRAHSRSKAVSPRLAPATAVSTTPADSATSSASTTSDRQRRRRSSRSQVSAMRMPAHPLSPWPRRRRGIP